jgi:hypothetical protein
MPPVEEPAMFVHTCPTCRAAGNYSDKYAGKTVLCSRCRQQIALPSARQIDQETLDGLWQLPRRPAGSSSHCGSA